MKHNKFMEFPEHDKLDFSTLMPDQDDYRVIKIVWRRIDPETGEEVHVEEITNLKLANIVRKK